MIVDYRLEGNVATITLDDGKVNAMSVQMQSEIHGALDRAQADGAVVLLAGRDGVFCAGFDLTVIRAGGAAVTEMVAGGFDLALRVLSFPMPVVIACTGHAIAMGAFLLLSGDYRMGAAAGNYRLVANEVTIGMTMPYTAIEIMRQRLSPAAFNRAITMAAPFSPANAVESGFLDELVTDGDLLAAARARADAAATLDLAAHTASKMRARAGALDAIRAGIAADHAVFAGR